MFIIDIQYIKENNIKVNKEISNINEVFFKTGFLIEEIEEKHYLYKSFDLQAFWYMNEIFNKIWNGSIIEECYAVEYKKGKVDSVRDVKFHYDGDPLYEYKKED